MKAVFDTKPGTAYEDDIAHRYNFLPRYLDVVSRCLGDWAVTTKVLCRISAVFFSARLVKPMKA